MLRLWRFVLRNCDALKFLKAGILIPSWENVLCERDTHLKFGSLLQATNVLMMSCYPDNALILSEAVSFNSNSPSHHVLPILADLLYMNLPCATTEFHKFSSTVEIFLYH